MRTPAGRECPHYYEDFYRGRSTQECRLIAQTGNSLPWEPRVCAICPVPAIRQANGCPHMELRARLVRRWLRRQVVVEAYCVRSQATVENPYVGCGQCHPDAATVLIRGGGDDSSTSH